MGYLFTPPVIVPTLLAICVAGIVLLIFIIIRKATK